MIKSLLLLLLLVTAAPATAQELRLPTATFAAAAAADWVSTYQAQQDPRRYEANPLLRWLRNKPLPLVALGAGMDTAGVIAWNHYVGRKHPKLAAVGLYAAAGFRAYIAIQNLRTTRYAKTIR